MNNANLMTVTVGGGGGGGVGEITWIKGGGGGGSGGRSLNHYVDPHFVQPHQFGPRKTQCGYCRTTSADVDQCPNCGAPK